MESAEMKTVFFLSFFAVSVAFGAVEVEDVTFGFGDGYKVGTYAPLTITVRNQDERSVFSGDLVVEVRNFSADTPIERYTTPLRLIGAEPKRKNLYVYCPRNATQLVIQVVPTTSSGGTTLEDTPSETTQDILLPTPFARKDYFVLVLAPSGDKLKRFIDKKQLKGSDGAKTHVRYLPNSRSLPNTWIGYSAVDVLVIRGIRLTERRISKALQTAMLDWVQRGGTLIISGGSNFNYLRGSFIDPYLPVELKGVEKINTLPAVLQEQLGFQSSGNNENPFERIRFVPKAGCEMLIGTEKQLYVAKRNFGDGQILCLAFDYNTPPFSEQQIGEIFWQGLLSKSGKSPKHLADQYALALRHEEKIYKEFLSKMPTQVPLIKLLSIVLPVCLLSFGAFLFYFGKSKHRSRIYWIGGCLFILLSMSAIGAGGHIFPNNITADRLSILSVYPERQRAHLQSYVSLRATRRADTSFDFAKRTFVRQQEVGNSGNQLSHKIGTLVQDSGSQLQDLSVEPWQPTTYVEETFLDAQRLPRILENTWYVTGKEMIYLGNVTLDAKSVPGSSTEALRLRVTPKMPPDKELTGTREQFAQILRQEYVLRYLDLAAKVDSNPPPYFLGWTPQSFKDIVAKGNVSTNDETLVIFRPGAGP